MPCTFEFLGLLSRFLVCVVLLAYSLLERYQAYLAKLCSTNRSGIPTVERWIGLKGLSAVKKPYLSLAATLFVALIPSFAAAQSDDAVTPLSNKDVVLMVNHKLETEAIINIIKASPCTFDTFPPVLREMKRRGVPEGVLLAMLEAPYGPSLQSSSRDDLGEQPIYHYAEQLKQLGVLSSANAGRRFQPSRRTRGRSRIRS